MLSACSNTDESNLFVQNLIEYNERKVQDFQKEIDKRGNNEHEIILFKELESFIRANRALIENLNNTDYSKAIAKQKELISISFDKSDKFKNIYKLFDFNEQTSRLEIRNLLLLIESQIIDECLKPFQSSFMVFNQLDVYFIPDYVNEKSLSGSLIVAGTSTKIGNNVEFYLDSIKLEKNQGRGVVKSDLIENKESINIKVEFPGYVITKEIKLKNRP